MYVPPISVGTKKVYAKSIFIVLSRNQLMVLELIALDAAVRDGHAAPAQFQVVSLFVTLPDGFVASCYFLVS